MTAETIQIGCRALPPRMAMDEYFQSLTYLETDVLVRSKPAVKTLASWRRKAPAHCSFGLTVPPTFFRGGMPTGQTEEWARILEAQEALEAEAIVFRPPPELSASAATQEKLKRFFGEIASATAETTRFVWQMTGTFSPALLLRLGEELNLSIAFDPLAQDPLEELEPLFAEIDRSHVYFDIGRWGASGRKLGIEEFEVLAQLASVHAKAWFVFGHVEAFRDARRLTTLLAGES